MDKEEVEVRPVVADGCYFVLEVVAAREGGHSGQLRQPAVHGVDGHGGGPEAEDFGKRWEGRAPGKAAEEDHVCLLLFGEHSPGVRQPAIQPFRSPVRLRSEGPDWQGGESLPLRVGASQVFGQPFAAGHEYEAMLAHRLNEDLHAGS